MPSHTATATQAVKSTTSMGGSWGAEKGGQIQPAAPGDWKERPSRPRAAGLLLRQHHQALRRARHSLALGLRVGGVDGVQTEQAAPPPDSRPGGRTAPLPHPVGGGLQAVAPVGGGGDLISLLAESLDGLPHGGAADTQCAAHGRPGQIFPGCASSRDRTVSRLKTGPSFKSAIRTCGLYYTRGGWVVSTEAGRQA